VVPHRYKVCTIDERALRYLRVGNRLSVTLRNSVPVTHEKRNDFAVTP